MRKHLGHEVYNKLGQARQELRWKNTYYFCDPALIPYFETHLNYDGGFYLDVGACDGRSSSNTYHLEKRKNWSGILVEPVMHQYFKSREFRDRSKNSFYCYACVPFNYTKDFVEMKFAGLMTISRETSDFNAEYWAEEGGRFINSGEEVVDFFARPITLEAILRDADAPKSIDFLSLDVEGAEYSVLSGVSLEIFRFKVIFIEGGSENRAVKLLLNFGYKIVGSVNGNCVLVDDRHSFR